MNDRFVRSYTYRVARAIVAQGVFPESDFEDLVQELKLAVIEGVPRFNPERAKWSTFVRLVVRGRAVSLQRNGRWPSYEHSIGQNARTGDIAIAKAEKRYHGKQHPWGS